MILKGERVTLRLIKIEDAPRFVKWLKDEEVRKLLSAQPKGVTLKKEKEWIKSLPKKKEQFHFAIESIDKIHIGSLGLRLDVKNKSAFLGIFIGDKNYWSKGYGYEAAKILINFGFNKLNLHRVELDVYDYNSRAINLYKKLGFKTEGEKREAVYWKGKFYNEIQMGILKSEWQK